LVFTQFGLDGLVELGDGENIVFQRDGLAGFFQAGFGWI